jgi:hypothetical protein
MNPRAKCKIELETKKMEAAFIGAVEAGEKPQELLDYLQFIATRKTGYRPPATANAGNAGGHPAQTVPHKNGDYEEIAHGDLLGRQIVEGGAP